MGGTVIDRTSSLIEVWPYMKMGPIAKSGDAVDVAAVGAVSVSLRVNYGMDVKMLQTKVPSRSDQGKSR